MEQITEDPRIKEALELLNNTAKDKKEQMQKLISDQYSNIRDVMGSVTSGTKSAVQSNPWLVLGGVAALCIAAGYLIGKMGED